MEAIRLQKFLADRGLASRRKAEELIASGQVFVNDQVATIGQKVSATDKVVVNGIELKSRSEKVYFLLNKPAKTVSTASDPQGRPTVVSLIKTPHRVFPVGRLDYDTTGTLLLTNDGELSHRLTHPSFEIKKVYKAKLDKALSPDEMSFLNSKRVAIDGKSVTQVVEKVGPKSYLVTLHEGLNQHVKKLFETVGAKVLTLTRLEFAGITHVGNLPQGAHRVLKPREIRWLKQLAKIPRT